MLKEYKGELLFLVIVMAAYLLMATLNLSHNYSYFAVVFGIFGLMVQWFFCPGNIKPLVILLQEFLFFL